MNDADTNVAAILVDYGPLTTHVSRSGDGITTLATEDCWGETRPNDDPCYRQVEKRLTDVTQWRVTKGILDALNRNSLSIAEPLVPDTEDWFRFPLLPQDYVFPAGHQIGIVVIGSFSGYSSIADQNRATITLDLNETSVELPVVGGQQALKDAGIVRQAFPPQG